MAYRRWIASAAALVITLGALVMAPFIAVGGATQAVGPLTSTLFAAGFSQPVGFVQDPSQPGVQVVVEQGGRVRVLLNGQLQSQDFLDIRAHVLSGGERGLLGLAFAPDYAASGRVFVNFTNLSGHTVIARFERSANPLQLDATSRFDLVWPDGNAFISQPFANHNGGHLAFGPDGYLYIGMGDGGSSNDPGHRAQNPATLLGKMLRIDVNVPDTDPQGYNVPAGNPFVGQSGVLGEIWAFGLRNPWRYSFDPVEFGGTGALVIGDVGQGAWEEVNYEPMGAGGRNYGWRNREGAHNNVTTLPPFSTPLTDPILEYSHTEGRSITGGVVYRGTALGNTVVGRYFYADFIFGRVWSVALTINSQTGEATAGTPTEHTSELGNAAGQPSSFGIDSEGELYVLNYARGEVYRIDSATPTPTPTPTPGPAVGAQSAISGSGAVVTIPHTPSGTPTDVLIAFQKGGPATTASVTYGGQPCVLIVQAINGNQRTEVWGLSQPPAGPQNVVITRGGTGNYFIDGFVTSLTGTNGVVDMKAATVSGNRSEVLPLTVASAAGDLVVGFAYVGVFPGVDLSMTPGAGQTERAETFNGNEGNGALSTKPGAASATMGYSWGTSSGVYTTGHAAISLRASAAPTPTPTPTPTPGPAVGAQSAISGSGAVVTIPHTPSGTPTDVLIAFQKGGPGTTASVTYGGQPCVLIVQAINGNQRTEVWGLHSPPAGPQNVVITRGGTGNYFIDGFVTSLTGTNGVVDMKAATVSGNRSEVLPLTVASAVGDLVVGYAYVGVFPGVDLSMTPGAGQTERGETYNGSEGNGALSTKPGATGVTMSYSWGTSSGVYTTGHAAISFRAAGTAPAPQPAPPTAPTLSRGWQPPG